MQGRHGGFKVLLICPPPVVEVGPIAGEFLGAAARSQGLAQRYQALAAARGIGFFDAGQVIKVSAQDGIHFEPDAHAALGRAVAQAIARL